MCVQAIPKRGCVYPTVKAYAGTAGGSMPLIRSPFQVASEECRSLVSCFELVAALDCVRASVPHVHRGYASCIVRYGHVSSTGVSPPSRGIA